MIKWWRVDPDRPDEGVLAQAARVVRDGGLVVFPTDTLYGLAADPTDAAAVRMVFKVKRRDAGEALPLVADSVEQLEPGGVSLTPLGWRLARAFWPGPLALVLDADDRLGPVSSMAGGTVAVRVPAHAVARGLARLSGSMVTATSANISGSAASDTAAAAVEGLAGGVRGVLDAGRTPGGRPSTIVDARGEAPLLIREGAVPFARVIAALETS
jgi:L-threonylcarbamoyladenylate synthase